MSRGGNIIDMLHDCEVSQFGKIHESSIKEDEWKKTMYGAHILVDDNNNIKAGGPPSMRKGSPNEGSITTQKTVSEKVNTKVSVEPYLGKRSGVKSLDKAFDDVRAAKAEWDKAKEDTAKAYKKVCKSLGIKADRKSSIYSSENQKKVKAAKDPEYIKALEDEDKAMSNHAKKTGVLKSEYRSYRDSGGEQIRDYYSASTEWDDYD